MSALCEHMLLSEQKLLAMNHWFSVLDNVALRMDSPDRYHEELLRQADEMDRLGLVDWAERQELRRLADRVWLRAVAGADYR